MRSFSRGPWSAGEGGVKTSGIARQTPLQGSRWQGEPVGGDFDGPHRPEVAENIPTALGSGRTGKGQAEAEGGTFPEFAAAGDLAVHRGGDASGDPEAESAGGFVSGWLRGETGEFTEEQLLVGLAEPGTVVRDLDDDAAISFAAGKAPAAPSKA